MPDVLFLTPGPIEWASSRFRAYWIAEHLENSEVIEFEQAKKQSRISPAFDNYIFLKSCSPEWVKLIKDFGKRAWWDLCDPVHWFDPKTSRQITEMVDGVVFSNTDLQNDFMDWYGKEKSNITIPDRLKMSHYSKQREHAPADPVRMIWFGANQNRVGLFGAVQNLERLMANGVNVSLTIFDDNPELTWRFKKFPVYQIGWDLSIENEVIATHDIALLPPYPGPWGKVKSNNKNLTAWACGLPVWDGYNYSYGYMLSTITESRKNDYSMWLKDYDVRISAQEWKDFINVS